MDKNEKVIVRGSKINKESLASVESKDALSKLEIFSHLPESERADAESELWEKLHPSGAPASDTPLEPPANTTYNY